ncbi:SRPBCC family protein [Pseudomonas fluorescens]
MPMVEFDAVLDGDAQKIWNVLKEFGQIQNWHPSIVSSQIEGGAAQRVGCIRTLTLTDGAVVRERLLALDDSALSLSYRFEEAPLPLDNYVASVKLVALTGQNKTLISWSASFDPQELNTAEHYQALIQSLIVEGHNGLQALIAQH